MTWDNSKSYWPLFFYIVRQTQHSYVHDIHIALPKRLQALLQINFRQQIK